MSRRSDRRVRLPLNILAAVAIVTSLLLINRGQTVPGASAHIHAPFCSANPQLCTETLNPWNYQGQYTGHDEPSLLFYSNTAGSGNTNLYHLTLPNEPTNLPSQDGSGGTWNFMLHPAFWFGMALCDDQSAPTPGKTCPADSDSNIYTSTDPSSPNYMGNTPGTAFMEMQFYPPGWSQWPPGVSCSATQWCAALNIDSFAQNENTGVYNNSACLNAAGTEYVNFAFITKNGRSQAPADPLDQTLATFTPDPRRDLFMSPGDQIQLSMYDTKAGFVVSINDVTTGQSGSMTAGATNGFGHPLYQPNASSCTDAPYSFHPMYSTSSPDTRVLWAAHSYNVAYSDEIGHFEYCNASSDPVNGGNCTSAGVTDGSKVDSDDSYCLGSPVGTSTTSITGCLGQDLDFDGPEYGHNWPGSDPNHASDVANHGTPITFSSPTSNGNNYSQAAFETDMPRIESSCHRFGGSQGNGCTNPPKGANFYPIFMAAQVGGQCRWEEGDVNLPNVTNTFGGSSVSEYSTNGLVLNYPNTGNTVISILEDYRNILSSNPC